MNPSRVSTVIAFALVAAVTAAGCSRSGNPAVTTIPPVPVPSHLLYVADAQANTIWVVPDTTSGGAVYNSIWGSTTQLSSPFGVTTDASGNVWVANSAANSITEYPSGKYGNVAPIVTIAGAGTTLSQPGALAFDGSGNLWVTNTGANDILKFAAAANGNVAPSDIITSSVLENPNAIAFDSTGLLWVSSFSQTNFDAGNISAFRTTDGLNASPTAELDGNNGTTQVSLPTGVAFDAAGDLFAGQFGTDTVNVYPPPVGGNEAPSMVTGSGIWSGAGPWGLAIDAAGNLFGADNNAVPGQGRNGIVRTFAAGALNGAGGVVPAHFQSPVGIWTR